MRNTSPKTLLTKLSLGACLFAVLGMVGYNLSSAQDKTSKTSWSVDGVVLDPRLTPNSILIKHEEVPGLMPAMSMPFTLGSRDLVNGLSYNDEIRLRFTRSEDSFIVNEITLLNSAGSGVAQPNGLNNDAGTNSFTDLSVRWESEFMNQFGKPVLLSDYKQKNMVLNFIYTRCPFVCPTQTADLQKVLNDLDEEQKSDLMFVSITLDPDHDSPQKMLEFANRYNIDFDNWLFLNGEKNQIERMMNSLNVMSFAIENKEYNHDSKVFLITHGGESVSVIDDVNKELSGKLTALFVGL